MNYGIILSLIDIPWVAFFFIGALFFGSIYRCAWISQKAMVSFVLFKMTLCVLFSYWAIVTNQDFDSAGYYVGGQVYADSFEELLRGNSSDYLQDTPFFGLEGISTDRLNSLTGMLLTFSGRSFMACALILCCTGIIGQLLVFRYITERFVLARRRNLYLLLFAPSPALWSSMLLKDSLGMFALGLMIYNLDGFLAKKSLRSLIFLILGAYIALQFRSFILVMVFVFSLFIFWDRLIASRIHGIERDKWAFFYITSSLAFSVGLLAYYINTQGAELVEQQHQTDANYAQIEGGSTFENAKLSYSFNGLLALGVGVGNTLLRPFPWEVSKLNQLMGALESSATFGVFALGWWVYLKRLNAQSKRYIQSIIYGSLFATIICAAGVGLYSSNVGTISRYRTPVMPIFLMGPCLALGMVKIQSNRRDFIQIKKAPRAARGGI